MANIVDPDQIYAWMCWLIWIYPIRPKQLKFSLWSEVLTVYSTDTTVIL
jgi:hypothetical protein